MGRKEYIEQLRNFLAVFPDCFALLAAMIMNDPSTLPEMRRAIRARIGGKTTDDAYKKYSKQVSESGGFDVDCFALSKIISYTIDEYSLPLITNFSKLAIEEYNKMEDANFVFVEVEKANTQVAGYVNFYVTFKANNQDAGGVTQTFQALILKAVVKPDVEVKFCRLKPNPGQGIKLQSFRRFLQPL